MYSCETIWVKWSLYQSEITGVVRNYSTSTIMGKKQKEGEEGGGLIRIWNFQG